MNTEVARSIEPILESETVEPGKRSVFLETVAEQIEDLKDLLEVCHSETNLPLDRLAGERTRTANQLRMFALLVREGSWVDARIDTALPDRKPLPKPDIRRVLQPLGLVAVFGASNFPLAFSVAGGDTASAWATGCPVIYKANPGHPKTSELVADAIRRAEEACGLTRPLFRMVTGDSNEIGQDLVAHPAVDAVAFTGSFEGGRALFDAASRRERPIPVFAEMGSLNPIILLPEAVKQRAEEIATGLAGSIALGGGQFCTKPGLILGIAAPELDDFLHRLEAALAQKMPGSMLNDRVQSRFETRLEEVLDFVVARGDVSLLRTDSTTFRNTPRLQAEIFGPAALVVDCHDRLDLEEVVAHVLEGQLTATVHATEPEAEQASDLFETLRKKAGRLILNQYPTGVEVCPSMHHGGPYPATTDPRFTSVGTAAVQRFARPICFQNFPNQLLPAELQNENPRNIWRTLNGKLTREPI
jgi:NADP-dependent aldehyde dehydrogenase